MNSKSIQLIGRSVMLFETRRQSVNILSNRFIQSSFAARARPVAIPVLGSSFIPNKRMASTASSSKKAKPTTFNIPLPDDWHHHLRDSKAKGDGRLETVAPIAAEKFGRMIVMPNLVPPVTTTAQALEYRERILACVSEDAVKRGFEPLMTLYLTDSTPPEEMDALKASGGKVIAVKLYPQGATTNSHNGVTSLEKVTPVLKRMAELGVPLCVHGEVTDPAIDPFDREKVFIERELIPLLQRVPELKVIMEHVTTKEAVDFVMSQGPNVAATITPQHLLYDRSHLFAGGLRPHFYCLPILKRANPHRLALLGAIASGSPKFFLGTDSAPHAQSEKEKDCGCAGCFTAHSALELYLEAFEEADALEHFENFACYNGAKFYGLPSPTSKTKLRCEKKQLKVPAHFPLDLAKGGESKLVPLRAGATCEWTVTVE